MLLFQLKNLFLKKNQIEESHVEDVTDARKREEDLL